MHTYTHVFNQIFTTCQQGARQFNSSHPAALVLSCLPGTNCSFFGESPQRLALHLQNEAAVLEVLYQLQRSTIFTVRARPTQFRSAAPFISSLFLSSLFRKDEAAFSTGGSTEQITCPLLPQTRLLSFDRGGSYERELFVRERDKCLQVLACKQDQLHNLQGLAQNENAGSLFKNSYEF